MVEVTKVGNRVPIGYVYRISSRATGKGVAEAYSGRTTQEILQYLRSKRGLVAALLQKPGTVVEYAQVVADMQDAVVKAEKLSSRGVGTAAGARAQALSVLEEKVIVEGFTEGSGTSLWSRKNPSGLNQIHATRSLKAVTAREAAYSPRILGPVERTTGQAIMESGAVRTAGGIVKAGARGICMIGSFVLFDLIFCEPAGYGSEAPNPAPPQKIAETEGEDIFVYPDSIVSEKIKGERIGEAWFLWAQWAGKIRSADLDDPAGPTIQGERYDIVVARHFMKAKGERVNKATGQRTPCTLVEPVGFSLEYVYDDDYIIRKPPRYELVPLPSGVQGPLEYRRVE
ncbi:MAG: hypothetical protein N3A38_12775 [Planctomycetota bacterium]|nr:hypothetical protein [Planctomycetota bacterium]